MNNLSPAEKVRFERERRFKDCKYKRSLPFDFFLPDFNILIEYHGVQHYRFLHNDFFGGEKALKERQKRDKIKKDYAHKNNFNFLEIPYTDFNNIENILKKRIVL